MQLQGRKDEALREAIAGRITSVVSRPGPHVQIPRLGRFSAAQEVRSMRPDPEGSSAVDPASRARPATYRQDLICGRRITNQLYGPRYPGIRTDCRSLENTLPRRHDD